MLRARRPTIGFLTALLRDQYTTVTWSGVMDVARERDVNVLNLVGSRLGSSVALEAPAQVMFDLVDPAMLDGIVVFSEMLYHFVSVPELKQFLSRYAAVPMTSIGVVDGIPSVMLDLELGMRDMLDHLIDVHGYRRLAYLSGPAGEQTAEALYRGYLQALKAHDIPFDPALVTPHLPSWGLMVGADGVRQLIDERRLKPGIDFDCIVGCADWEILQAVDMLQARGVRVPSDVAVTGFNNLEPARLASPSLTTVDRQIAELSRRATEMLLDLLDGHSVPQKEILSPELKVRRSCGCIPETVRQAASALSLSVDTPAQWDRDHVIAEVTRAGRPSVVGHVAGLDVRWAEHLVESFNTELAGNSPSLFLITLEEILRQVIAADCRVRAWQGVLSVMRRSLRPYLHDDLTVERAEDIWQQARTLIGDFAERDQGRRRINAARQVQVLSDISQALITTFDINELMEVLARDLPLLGIPGCYLSLYEDPTQPLGWARLLLAYDQRGRITLDHNGERFPARSLVPPDLLQADWRRDLVGLPLHFHDEQLGFVVLEMGPQDGNIYEALRLQIGSALKGALLATRNVELYREAVEARKVAEAADGLKSRFLSTVSHELRTPLSLIVGTIEMQLREEADSHTPLPERYQRDLRNIRSSAQHLARLISDVLDLASSQAGQLRLTSERLRLVDVFAQVTALGEALAREKGLAWSASVPDSLPLVWGDRTRLQQVALNLISNAVKFTRHGTISLWVEVGKQQLVVAVSDTGLGIPLSEQESIFDEFSQSERTMSRGFGGMGLGLAISRRLIELHGGKIGVLSSGTDGSGSTFYFSLPILTASDNETAAPSDRSGIVLVLTEQPGDNNLLCQHLGERGFVVELLNVNTQPKWLAQLIVSPPGAVVLDYEPTGERGWELMQLLRQNLRLQDIPIVFYSLSDDLDQGAALELDYLIKPVSSADLARALARQGFSLEDSARARTILVVDDDPGILDLHVRILEKLAPRSNILKARDGREALEILAQRRPDLVLLDLMMPVVDGFAVLEAMRERESTRDVPVIVLSAQILTTQDMTRLQQGVAAILAKGIFTSAEVLAQVETVLNRRKHLSSDVQRVVRQAMAYIHEQYALPISRSDLATHVGISERHLTHCFRQETGLTPVTYLNRYRIRQARTLLEQGGLNVTEVALAVGFSDSSYFARVFREEIGVSPHAYQQGERPHVA
jgi:signal transduction histidine kinase/DNA-binding LacI/PurR family transcriptional regulator/AraC-like DNA-binding protein/DNA-binding LytR/AlgR family response regulator